MTTTTSSNPEKIPMQVLVTPIVRYKQNRLVAACKGEVYWFGLVDYVQVGRHPIPRVYDIVIPAQEVTSGSVHMEGTMNAMMEEMIAEGRGDEIERLRYFAHSHGDNSVFHSAIDMGQIWDYANEMEIPWFISHIQNRRGDTETRFDQFVPFRVHVNKLKLIELWPADVDSWVKAEVERKVKQKRSIVTTGGSTRKYPANLELVKKLFPNMEIDPETTCVRSWTSTIDLIVNGFMLVEYVIASGKIRVYAEPTEQDYQALKQRLSNQYNQNSSYVASGRTKLIETIENGQVSKFDPKDWCLDEEQEQKPNPTQDQSDLSRNLKEESGRRQQAMLEQFFATGVYAEGDEQGDDTMEQEWEMAQHFSAWGWM